MSFQSKSYQVYTVRLPVELARAVREAADRHYEPQSVLVRRLVERGLKNEERDDDAR